MGHTNSTVNYNLPQFTTSDKPSWLGDVNGAFLAIDTAIAAAKAEADSAAGGVAGLQTTVSGHTTQIGTLTDTVTAQGGTLNSVTALIGNGTPTTTDQTIIGAINELADIVEAGQVSVTADGVKTYAQLLNELAALVIGSKIKSNTKLLVNDTYYYLTTKLTGEYYFVSSGIGSGGSALIVKQIYLAASASYYKEGRSTAADTTFTDLSSGVVTNGQKIAVVY